MKKRKLKLKHVIYALLVCYVGYTFVSQQFMINRMKDNIDKYTQQNDKIVESNKYLKDQIEYAKTQEYKEKVAREKMGLIKPGETVYVIDGEN
jgi:cell division protein FtsB